jgi:CubicO group peptidase (beta-lactamase class C family)
MTKSVVALGVGRAIALGRLGLDDPIGRYLPEADAAHGAITVRELLTQTSGLRFAWVNDLLGSTEDSVGEAMSMPIVHPPGTFFEYAQTTVTTLALVVERAVGEDFQTFMATELFEPIGIPTGSWTWAHDGVGHTQGYAWLEMRPIDMARLGTLALDRGRWDGRQLIDAAYIGEMGAATPTNGGYGFLAQTNAGPWHIGTFGGVRKERRVIPSAPVDTLIFSGFLEQATYVVPSLDLVIVRFGLPPDAQWKDRLFRQLLAGFPDAPPQSTGPLPPADPIELDWNQILDIGDLIRRNDAMAGR